MNILLKIRVEIYSGIKSGQKVNQWVRADIKARKLKG